MTPGEELVEVLDPAGAVVGCVSRARMRSENLRHRAVYVAVLSHNGALLVHRRAAWKDVWPSRWDVAVGGVLAVGEAWHDAALRELGEEMGVRAAPGALEDLGPGGFEDAEVRVVGHAFAITHEGPFTFADGEVEAVDWVPLAELDSWLEARRPMVCPDGLAIVLPHLNSAR